VGHGWRRFKPRKGAAGGAGRDVGRAIMEAMITLHYRPGSANLAPHILLREAQAEFTLALVDPEAQAHKSPAYLKLNPNGLIPVLVDTRGGSELVLYETAALLLHLADTHPAAALAPALGTAERAQYYKWMAWLTNTMQAYLIHYFYPERLAAEGDTAAAAVVKARAMARVQGCLEQLNTQLASHGQPWLLGERYSAVDPFAWMLCRWTRNFAERPGRSFEAIAAFQARMLARPAVQAALAAEGLQAPHA
jgi:glutathione S-transferase